jgi:uncharacterized protein
MFYLGNMYLEGKGVAKDEAEAARWLRRSADAGFRDAMNNLAGMYRDGRGVAQNESEAVRLFRKAADAGNANAMTSTSIP